MEHICYEERLELFILEKFLGNLVTAQLFCSWTDTFSYNRIFNSAEPSLL